MLPLFIAVLFFAHAVTMVPVDSTTETPPHTSVTGALNEFSFALLNRLSQEDKDANVFASPLSVASALSMLLLGAKGSTADEISKVMHFDHLVTNPDNTVHQQMKLLLDAKIRSGSSVSLANYLLVRKQSGVNAVLNNFKNQVSDLYSAQVDDVDFSQGPKIMADVNKWVKNTTHGLIDSILSAPPAADCRALVLNSIYFKGEWEQKFSAAGSHNSSFFNKGSEETTTVFMVKNKKHFPYAEVNITGSKVQVLELPYEKDSLSMLILLPETRDGLKGISSSPDFERDLSAGVSAFEQHKKRTEMNLKIPKFKIASDYSLVQPLTQLGVGKMFTEEADLSGVTGETNLFVKSAKHKAVVSVDEDGTEAAAVTMFDAYPMSAHFPYVPPVEFVADHPFLFLIVDQVTGLVLFVGKVQNL